MVAKGNGNFREAAVYLPDQGVRVLGFYGSTSRPRNIHNPKRVSEGFQQKDWTSRVERVGFWPSPPPHQTVRTDFPYTAFAVTSSDGIINEDAKPSRTVQTKVMHVGIEGLTHRRTVGALASTLQVLRQFFQHIGMDCSKTFPRITVTEVVHPTGLPLVDLSNHRHNRHEAARLIGEGTLGKKFSKHSN